MAEIWDVSDPGSGDVEKDSGVGMQEAQNEAQVRKKRRSKPRPKTSHFETGSWKLRNMFAQTRGMEGLFEEDAVPICKLPQACVSIALQGSG